MGIDVRLEDEFGESLGEIGDPRNLLRRLMPDVEDEAFPYLRFVDPYGNTTFNKLQMGVLLSELKRVKDRATTEEERGMLGDIQSLAQRCQLGTHLYIKFYGD